MVPQFDTADEMWLDGAAHILHRGTRLESRDGPCFEHEGYVARLSNPAANFMFNPHRRMSPNYAAAELLWYLSGDDDVEMICAYAPQYERFANDGRAHGAYGKRWSDGDHAFHKVARDLIPPRHSQLEAVVDLLALKPQTRQAVLTCWNAGDLIHALIGDKADLPCTLSLLFNVREGKLNLTVTMRSNDIWLGMPYDVFCFTGIQMLVASAIGAQLGWYQHQVASLHVYDRDMARFKDAANPPSFKTGPLDYDHRITKLFSEVRHAVRLEDHNRRVRCVTKETPGGGESTLLSQLVYMAADKWTDRAVSHITNPLMAKYMEARRAHT